MNGIQAGAHGLQLPEAEAGEPVFRDQLRYRGAGDVFLENALIFRVDVQQARHGDPGGQEPLIITLLGGKLVPELIILAWLVVDLLDDVFAALVCGQIGIAALSLAEQPPDGKHSAVYCDLIFHVSRLHRPQHSRRAGRLSSKNPLRRKYWQIE